MRVLIRPESDWKAHATYVQADVIDEAVLSHHDPAKLAGVIAATYRTHRGIRRRFPGVWSKPKPVPSQSNGKVHI